MSVNHKEATPIKLRERLLAVDANSFGGSIDGRRLAVSFDLSLFYISYHVTTGAYVTATVPLYEIRGVKMRERLTFQGHPRSFDTSFMSSY